MLEGWRFPALSDVATFVSGGTPNKAKPEFWDGDIPWVTVSDMKSLRLTDAQHKLTPAGASQVRMVEKGTILVLVRGMGLFKDLPILLCEDPLTFNQDIKGLIPNSDIDSEYLAYALIARKSEILRHVDSAGHGTGRLDTDLLKSTPVPLPPLTEQRRIAEILRTWDEAIEKLEALRTAKERRLAGVSRYLFAKAANDPATVMKPLATMARIVKGQQLNKLDILYGDYAVWNGGITPSGFHNEWNTEGGTITISEGGNSCGFVNLARQPFWLGGHCYALRDLSQIIEQDFLFHTLKSREPEIMRLRVGSGLPNIQRADLERLTVVVPPHDLQEKIANAITAGTAEVELTDKEITALQRQKRGLMQKLLTGEWRVSVDPSQSPTDEKEAAHG